MNLIDFPTPRFEPVDHGSHGDLPDVFPKGRVCLRDGCGTVLSIYNPGRFCWLDKRFEADEEVAYEEAKERALDALPGRDREILTLRDEGYSFRQIAPSVGVSAQRVQQIVARFSAKVEREMVHSVDEEDERPALRLVEAA